jgi:TPP-dependent pyruvate/acetoin dehydrogenase alpha subunit
MNLSPEQIQQYHDVIEEVGPEFLRDKLAQMHLIRTFEQQIDQLHQTGKTHGTSHLSIGQEATSVAAISAVRESGYLLSHHRGHGHFLSWSDDPNRLPGRYDARRRCAVYCVSLCRMNTTSAPFDP